MNLRLLLKIAVVVCCVMCVCVCVLFVSVTGYVDVRVYSSVCVNFCIVCMTLTINKWISVTVCVRVCVRVSASALQCMRSKNVSHMDLKPHNILLTATSSPSLKIAGLHHINSHHHHIHNHSLLCFIASARHQKWHFVLMSSICPSLLIRCCPQWFIFTKRLPLVHFVTKVNWLPSGIKRSKSRSQHDQICWKVGMICLSLCLSVCLAVTK